MESTLDSKFIAVNLTFSSYETVKSSVLNTFPVSEFNFCFE